jgi:hypothetical protein
MADESLVGEHGPRRRDENERCSIFLIILIFSIVIIYIYELFEEIFPRFC